MSDVPRWLSQIMQEERLPSSFVGNAMGYYVPLAKKIQQWQREKGGVLVVGVNGAQGTGKSTMSKVLATALQEECGCCCAVISIDDIYQTKAVRAELAQQIHPLLATRGVPGTHDTTLGMQVIQDLMAGKLVPVPSFDKASDDRRPESEWTVPSEAVDVILFEGWCIGAVAEPPEALPKAINVLEEKEDADGAWRGFVNERLQSEYVDLFALLDRLVMIKAPDFECVHHWRGEQEDKLRASKASEVGADLSGLMSVEQLERFIMHYERLTRWMFDEMPGRADVLFELSAEHIIESGTGLSS
ncbi:kinase [Verrucomicrobiaceae bacterium N1E253]|uniref:Kinase n=1 Tax=Oceaniferula marina TaxID=2748318 RepID=A0A851GIF3_9BACT|nr:kinase [Oceaniferula marina]NWK57293.1 kinase [Oceaniferula marina]